MPQTRRFPVTPATLFLLAGLAGCSDDPATPAETPPANVSVESSHRKTATIGEAGGSIATTSDAGVTYTLDVPPGAFAGDVDVAITPISAVRNLPFPGRLEGGVRLDPSGLKLLKPAVLTIGKAASPGNAEELVGFSYEGDAASYEPASTTEGPADIRILVTHFSGAGAGSGSSQGIDAWLAALCAAVPTLTYPVSSQIDCCWNPPEPKRDWFIRTARDYVEDIVTPIVQGAGDLSAGVVEYIEWYTACDELATEYDTPDWETVLDPEITAVQQLLTTRLVAEVAAEKAAMCAQGGVEHLRLVLEYSHLAYLAGLDDEMGLRPQDILQGLCATVNIAELDLPQSMPVGTDHSLDMRAELLVNGQREDALFHVDVAVTNGTCGGAPGCNNGRSNGLGEYTTVIRRTGQGPIVVTVEASLLVSLFVSTAGGGYAPVETILRGADSIARENAGGLVLTANRTRAQTTAPSTNQYCIGSGTPDDVADFPGDAASVSAGLAQTCTFPTYTSNYSASVDGSSNPGIAVDGQSALMTFESTGSLGVSVTGSEGGAEVNGIGTFAVWFDVVGNSIAFDLTVASSFTGDPTTAYVAIQRTDQGGAVVASWSGLTNPSGGVVLGSLPPGSYLFGCTFDMSAIGSIAAPGNATWSANVSLELGAGARLTSGSR